MNSNFHSSGPARWCASLSMHPPRLRRPPAPRRSRTSRPCWASRAAPGSGPAPPGSCARRWRPTWAHDAWGTGAQRLGAFRGLRSTARAFLQTSPARDVARGLSGLAEHVAGEVPAGQAPGASRGSQAPSPGGLAVVQLETLSKGLRFMPPMARQCSGTPRLRISRGAPRRLGKSSKGHHKALRLPWHILPT